MGSGLGYDIGKHHKLKGFICLEGGEERSIEPPSTKEGIHLYVIHSFISLFEPENDTLVSTALTLSSVMFLHVF